MKIKILAMVSALLIVVSNPAFTTAGTPQPLTVNIKRLSLDTAMRIGKAAIDKCRKEGVQITVTVVDRGGAVQIVMRDTLAMDISVPISKKKAYTAMSFNSPTSVLENRFTGAYNDALARHLVFDFGQVHRTNHVGVEPFDRGPGACTGDRAEPIKRFKSRIAGFRDGWHVRQHV